jgi:DNA-binding XRE family transcriptional regulator
MTEGPTYSRYPVPEQPTDWMPLPEAPAGCVYTIGSTIRRLRHEIGITQQQLADLCDTTRPAVAQWETLRSNPEISRLPAIAAALNTRIATFFKE